ncbi:formyltetrahydrofolate deformylase [Nocardia heshunensis]
MERYVVTLRCRDRPGIVRALSDAVFELKGNIVESQQFYDDRGGTFCLRMTFDSPETDVTAARGEIEARLREFDPVLKVRCVADRPRVLVMVSREDHCLEDLLYRRRIGELPIEVPLVVSNHETGREAVQRHGIGFEYLPVTRDSKPAAETRLLELIAEHRIDLVVLARYMQVLSDDLCRRLDGRAINIHHSFLPGFKGARPYHQAHLRGVKLIGATAHYVTAELDEGPIIEQDVVRVDHHHSAEQLVAMGRDVERMVLARAVRLHAEDRVLRNGDRTVVFA